MSRFWLVQQLRFHEDEGKRFWTDHPSHFSIEYMGSAEFEYGALAPSLKRLVPIADRLVFERVSIASSFFDLLRKPDDVTAGAQLAAWIAACIDPGRKAMTTKEWPHGLINRLEGKLSPTPPAGRGGKEHQRKMYSWKRDWEASGVLHWDIDSDLFFAFTPGQGPDDQPPEGVVAAFLAEIRAVAAARRG